MSVLLCSRLFLDARVSVWLFFYFYTWVSRLGGGDHAGWNANQSWQKANRKQRGLITWAHQLRRTAAVPAIELTAPYAHSASSARRPSVPPSPSPPRLRREARAIAVGIE